MPDFSDRSTITARADRLPPAAGLLDTVGISCVLLGDSIAGLSSYKFGSMLGFSLILYCGVLLILVRHLIWPRPSVLAVLTRLLRRYLGRSGISSVWAIALASRAVILLVGVVVVTAPGYHRPSHAAGPVAASGLEDLPSKWDAQWYLSIARHGYIWNPRRSGSQQNIAFFPAYPALMHVAGDILTIPAKALRDPMLFGSGDARVLWGGVLVSIFCFGLALQRVHALALLDGHTAATAKTAILLLACYPFALFFGAVYSESLAMLTLASTVLAWRRYDDRRVAAWGLAAGLARSNGWALSLALLADWLIGRREDRTRLALAAAMAPAAGAALFCAYIYYRTGNPLAWATAQRAWVGEVGPLFFLIRRAQWLSNLGLRGYISNDPVDVISTACVLLMLAMAAVLAVRREWLYTALIACYLAPALAIDLPAKGRLTAVLFPAFIAIATLVNRRSAVALALIFSIAQAWLAARFFQWQPPF